MFESKTTDELDVALDGLRYEHGGRSRWRCWHRWRWDTKVVWKYGECKKCGRRKAVRGYTNLMGPVDLPWVLTGKESELAPPAHAKLVDMVAGLPPVTPPTPPKVDIAVESVARLLAENKALPEVTDVVRDEAREYVLAALKAAATARVIGQSE